MNKIISIVISFILILNTAIPLNVLGVSKVLDSNSQPGVLEYKEINAEKESINGIAKLHITPLQGRQLIHKNNHKKDGFKNDIFEYNYYLLSTDTKELKLEVSLDEINYTLDVVKVDNDGSEKTYELIDDTNIKGLLDFNADNTKRLEVIVKLGGTDKTYMYTINIHSSKSGTTDPKIHLSVKKDKGQTYAELLVSLENVETNTFGFSLNSISNDIKFTDKNGKVFSDINEPLHGDKNNYYELQNDMIILNDMASDGNSIRITAASKDEKQTIIADDKGLDTYKFRMSAKATDTANDVIQSLTIVEPDFNDMNNITNAINSNVLFDYRYWEVKQQIKVDTAEEIKRSGSKNQTLTYIDAGNLKTVEMYVSHLTSDDLVSYTIKNETDENDAVTTKLDDGKLKYQLKEGTYTININSDGYLAYNKNGVDIYSDKDTFLKTINLLAGDVDSNGDINSKDRAALISVHNKMAENGIVNTAEGAVAADFNNDKFVNALDLGELLRNIGRFYK